MISKEKNKFSKELRKLLDLVTKNKERVILKENNKMVAAIVPGEDLEFFDENLE